LKRHTIVWAILSALFKFVSGRPQKILDDTVLHGAEQDTGNWLMYGGSKLQPSAH